MDGGTKAQKGLRKLACGLSVAELVGVTQVCLLCAKDYSRCWANRGPHSHKNLTPW